MVQLDSISFSFLNILVYANNSNVVNWNILYYVTLHDKMERKERSLLECIYGHCADASDKGVTSHTKMPALVAWFLPWGLVQGINPAHVYHHPMIAQAP